jgi:protocatechuate 3,4-dioxygenase beta subunit
MLLQIFLCGLFSAAMLGQQGKPPVQETGNFQITGTVVDAGTNQLLSSARVVIAPITKRDAFTVVVTGQNGSFSFSNLTPGKYSLSAQRRGYLTQGFNQHDQFASAIAVGPGMDSGNLVFRMTADASISGMVMDEEGEAVRDAHVMLYQNATANGSTQTRYRTSTVTNDEGHYHFGHLQAGKYFVAVSARPWYAQHPQQPRVIPSQGAIESSAGRLDDNEDIESGPQSPLDVAYPLTFYANATDASSATPIVLGKGEKVSADVSLHPVPAVHIRFSSESADQQFSYANLEVKLFDETPVPIQAQNMPIAPGVLELSGIPPGHYTAKINTLNNGKLSGPQEQEIDVAGSGTIEKGPASTAVPVVATVHFEPTGVIPEQLALQLRDKKSTQVFSESIGSKGEVEFKSGPPPGNYEISVQSGRDIFIKNIHADGGKLTGRTLAIKSDNAVKLTVTLAGGRGDVSGVATREGKPFPGAMVVLVPADPANNHVLFRRDQSDSDGSFRLAGVVPGQYTLLAIDDGWDLEWANPEVLKKFMTQGERVTVEPRGRYSIKVKVQ